MIKILITRHKLSPMKKMVGRWFARSRSNAVSLSAREGVHKMVTGKLQLNMFISKI